MLAFALDHPAPATVILITGDRDFAYATSVLRARRYRVIILSLPHIHETLKAQADEWLEWDTAVQDFRDVLCLMMGTPGFEKVARKHARYVNLLLSRSITDSSL